MKTKQVCIFIFSVFCFLFFFALDRRSVIEPFKVIKRISSYWTISCLLYCITSYMIETSK